MVICCAMQLATLISCLFADEAIVFRSQTLSLSDKLLDIAGLASLPGFPRSTRLVRSKIESGLHLETTLLVARPYVLDSSVIEWLP